MAEQLPEGSGTALLVIPMPGGVRPPTDTAEAMIAWLYRHGAPRTGEALRRLQRADWAIELPDPTGATQGELWASTHFADVAEARAAAVAYLGRVSDLMRWTPDGRPGDAMTLPLAAPDTGSDPT